MAERVFTDMNDALCRMTGYDRNELIGKNTRLLYPSREEYEYVGRERLAQIRLAGSGTVETRWKHKNGSFVDVILNFVPFDKTDYSRGMSFTALDVTAWKKTRNERDRLFMLSVDMFCIAGFDGYFKQLNPSWSRVLGWSTEELLSRPWIEFVHPEDRTATQGVKERLVDGKTIISFENRYLCKDGSVCWLSWDSYPVPEENLMYGVARDVTEQKLREAEYHDELHFRTAIVDSIAEGVAVYYKTHGEPESRFTIWNEKMAEITGYTLKEINSADWIATLFPEPRSQEKARIRKDGVYAGKQVVNEEWTITRKNGERRIVAVYAAALATRYPETRYLVTALDITDRKKAEEEIRREQELLARITSLSPIGIVQVDREGCIRFGNSRIEKLIGVAKESVLGKFYVDTVTLIQDEKGVVISPEERIKIEDLKEPIYGVERTLTFLGGRRLVVMLNIAPLFDRQGNYDGAVITFQDISEARRTEQELLKKEKLESLGALAGGIAHDFRNLLEGIFGSIEMAKLSVENPAEVQQYLRMALGAFDRAKHLTEQLLTFAKGGAPVRQTAYVTDLVREATEFALSGSAVEARYRADGDLWPVSIDQNQMAQVVNNLVLNARQAMEHKGTIEISLGNRGLTRQSGLPLPPGRYVEIKLKDSGPGIPPELIGKIFDPFYTTKDTGSGLGLSVSYSIIKKHDGHLTVVSPPGEGASFFIYLPATDSGEAPVHSHAAAVPLRGKGRVLVMDDEEVVLKVTADMLTSLGYAVATARGGKEAIRMYKESEAAKEPFDVLILDLTVPGDLGGVEVMAALASDYPAVTAIVASGYSDEHVLASPARFGFAASIRKPYRVKGIAAVLQTVGVRKHTQDRP